MQTNRMNYLSSVTGPNLLFMGRGSFPDQENFWPRLATKSTSNKLENPSSKSDAGQPLRRNTTNNEKMKWSIAEELDATRAHLRSTQHSADIFLKAHILRNQQDERTSKSLSAQIHLLTSAKSMHENELRELRKSRVDTVKELEESRKKLADLTTVKEKLEQTLQRMDYLLDSKICVVSSLSGQITHLGQLLSEQYQGMRNVKSLLAKLDQPGLASMESTGRLATTAGKRAGLFVRGNINQPQPQPQQAKGASTQTKQHESIQSSTAFARRLQFAPSRISLPAVCIDPASDASMEAKLDEKYHVPPVHESDSKDTSSDDVVDPSSLSVDLQQPEDETGNERTVDNTEDFKWLRNSLRETLVSKASGTGLRMGEIINSSKISPVLRQALYRVNDYISSALAGHQCGRSISCSFIQDIKLLCKQWQDLDVFCVIFESQAK